MKISKIIGITLALVLVMALSLSITACKGDDPTPTPANKDITGVTFEDASFTYDGQAKTVTVGGTLPEGVNVQYENNSATDAGTYNAKATLSGEGYNTLVLEAKLVIDPAQMNLGFADAQFAYDGTEKSITVTGTLPEGANVQYTDNKATDAGTYTAKVTVTCKNYKTFEKQATLLITPLDMVLSFTKGEFTYDGQEHEILVSGDVPEGASVEYVDNKKTNAGNYTASVTVTCKNYNTFTASVPFIINKADITGVTLGSITVTYDGQEHEILVSGDVPEGVEVKYTGNKATEVGNHPVTAVLEGKNYNKLELTAAIIITEPPVPEDQDIVGITFDPAEFTYDGTPKSIEIKGTKPEGVSVEYIGNGKIDHGTYTVTAVLSGKGYKTLELQAVMKINKATIEGITFNDGSFTYAEGVYHSIFVTGDIPEGVKVEYTGNNVTYAGTYKVTVVLSGDNYETLTLEATLYVKGSNGSGLLTPEHPFGKN